MDKKWRLPLSVLALLVLGAAGHSSSGQLPAWLLGDWTPIDIRQDADTLYSSAIEDPKHWFANEHLVITPSSLTLADDRCEIPAVAMQHDRPAVPLHEMGGGTLESLGYPIADKPVDYVSFACAHELHRGDSKTEFVPQDDRGIPISWYAIVRSRTEIDLPFFGGSYIKFRKTGPAS